ncbi:uncharacterized protein LOC141580446 [Saimiri boliviensis]|uniref:uncharacterized protein LOC141580446 n=1 Tax=Saimiri boliviensis TaxID=27679 RepID=UPI003D77F328
MRQGARPGKTLSITPVQNPRIPLRLEALSNTTSPSTQQGWQGPGLEHWLLGTSTARPKSPPQPGSEHPLLFVPSPPFLPSTATNGGKDSAQLRERNRGTDLGAESDPWHPRTPVGRNSRPERPGGSGAGRGPCPRPLRAQHCRTGVTRAGRRRKAPPPRLPGPRGLTLRTPHPRRGTSERPAAPSASGSHPLGRAGEERTGAGQAGPGSPRGSCPPPASRRGDPQGQARTAQPGPHALPGAPEEQVGAPAGPAPCRPCLTWAEVRGPG